MQTVGIKGGRTYKPYAYTEQGVAMLTSTLHTEQAIAASIQIIEAFFEMRHYLWQSRQLLPYQGLHLLSDRQDAIESDVKTIKETMVTRDDLSDLMKLFSGRLNEDEILILDGQPFKADLAYQKIYQKAKQSLVVVDNYIGVKTLQHMAHAKRSVALTVISDNKGARP